MTQIELPFETTTAPRVVRCRPCDATRVLGEVIDDAKEGDRLAAVTVVVATNVAGVMARRALGRRVG
ncbi:MAG: hypothetical protein AAGG08_13575, partial [Actinomycetota bacterium]